MSEWEPSQYVTLTRKENWWGTNDTLLDNKSYPEKLFLKL